MEELPAEKLGFEPDWEILGVEDIPRLEEFDPRLSLKRMGELRKELGYSGYIEVRDRDLHGLPEFLKRIEEAEESLRPRMACVLWQFLVRHRERRGVYSMFFGTYSWFYYKARVKQFDARVVKRLRKATWLSSAGGLCRPAEVSLADLPDEFERDENLASALGMKSDGLDALASQSGVPIEVLQHFKDSPAEWEAYKKWRAQQPQFPPLERFVRGIVLHDEMVMEIEPWPYDPDADERGGPAPRNVITGVGPVLTGYESVLSAPLGIASRPVPDVALSAEMLRVAAELSNAYSGNVYYNAHVEYMQRTLGAVRAGGSAICDGRVWSAIDARATSFPAQLFAALDSDSPADGQLLGASSGTTFGCRRAHVVSAISSLTWPPTHSLPAGQSR